jgi:hypothetical protein
MEPSHRSRPRRKTWKVVTLNKCLIFHIILTWRSLREATDCEERRTMRQINLGFLGPIIMQNTQGLARRLIGPLDQKALKIMKNHAFPAMMTAK